MKIAGLELPIGNEVVRNAGTTMKALVYHGPGKRTWEDKPRPTIQDPEDAIVRITTKYLGETTC
jgi:hypothetical protein